jgi:peptidoglycan/LPS O-acetylase OafA/YrhL
MLLPLPHIPHSVVHNPHLAYRPDIDGLRALAIVAVVIFHAFPHYLPGGFVGVDIFFVISGYLITSIILKAQSGDGFSLLDFYSRRIKRIFPTLIVVLGFCLAAGWFVLLADEYKALGKHVAAGAGYISNFILKGESGYFDTAADLKPLLHLWSLGIEEQFYLVWPLLLIFGLRGNLNPLAIIVFTLAISFMLNIAYIGRLPTQVFYLPISRAWELLIGAILAYINLYKRHDFDRIASKILLRNPHQVGNHLANTVAWTGVALIVLTMVGLDRSKAFPGWWALFPTIGAVFLIMAGEKAWLNRCILSSKIAVYLGLISYPIYLWHWPLLTFARIIENDTPSAFIRLSVIFLSVLLAWATYWLIEKRLRYRQHWVVATGLFIILATIGGLGYQVYRQAGYLERYPQAELVARNVGAQAWDSQGWNHQAACTEKFGDEFQQYCEINDINKFPTVLLIGDSNANHFYPGLAQAYARTKDNLLNLGQGACPPFFGTNVTSDVGDLHCEKSIDIALEYALESKTVKTVVLSMLPYTTPRKGQIYSISYPHNSVITAPLEILEDAMRLTLRRLTAAGKQVVFIISIPQLDFDPATCVSDRPWRITPAQLKNPCATPRKEADKLSGAYRSMVKRVLQDFPQVRLWDSTRELCDGEYCWAMKDGVLLYRDSAHLNEAGSFFMGERLPLQDLRKTLDR